MTDRELMQQAMDYVRFGNPADPKDQEIRAQLFVALQKRLAQPEQQTQQRPPNCGTSYCSCIECVMEPEQPEQSRAEKMRDAGYTRRPTLREIASEDEQPEQEPVAWRYRGNLHEFDPSDWAEGPVTPLYTTPPRREWVGLTDAELAEFSEAELGAYDLCLEVEAKLKEKNT